MARPNPRPAPVISAILPASRREGGGISGARRPTALVQPERREVDGPRPPHLPLAEDELDQPLDHPQARRTADNLGMGEPVEEAALGVEPLELLGPDLPDVLLAPDAVADRRHRAPHEKRSVIVAPRGGE